MSLNKYQKARKKELLDKYNQFQRLDYDEARELQDLIKMDDDLDEGTKLLIIFGLGALVGYLLTKDK